MNDKLLTFTIIIFFAGIIINGMLLMVASTPSGAWITNTTGFTNSTLSRDSVSGIQGANPNGFISNTSQSQDVSSFNPLSLDGILPGFKAINLIISALFLLEALFVNLGLLMPLFSPILFAVACIFAGAKILLIGYAFSVLVKALTGGR